MKYIVSVISACMIILLCGCTLETQTKSLEEKVETPVEHVSNGKELSVHFLDVGQGDSIFIQSPEGKNMLIDAGKREAGADVVSYLRNQGVKKLDYVVATHPDADHIGGLIAVLNSISIKRFIDSGKVHTSQTYEKMLQLIQAKNIPFSVPAIGDTIPLDPNLEVKVLNVDEDAGDNNEASIVLKVTYNGVSFLLTGDADSGVEQKMLNDFNVKSTILKAGHHGSSTSSSKAFLSAVNPAVTILSYEEGNSYGHPNREVVSLLKRAETEVYATAEVGNIVVKTNGVDYTISTGEKPKEVETPKKETQIEKESSTVNISSKELREEVVGITNSGDTAVNLNGWQLFSIVGNQTFNFPNINLDAGKTLYITSGPNAKEGQGYVKWTNGQMWRNDGDAAQLINDKGEIVSEVE